MSNHLPYLEGVDVGTNEIVTRMSLNRNFAKLLSNDTALTRFMDNAYAGFRIREYKEGQSYDYGDLIWLEIDENEIYLLKCLLDGNMQDPRAALGDDYVYGAPDFEKYGWKNQNDKFDPDRMGLSAYTARTTGQIMRRHETDPEDHFFGRLSFEPTDADYYDWKLMRSDVSNVEAHRDSVFYPYRTGHFETDSIVNGTYRAWDNGLLEFDIVYRLGWRGRDMSRGYEMDMLSCNDLTAEIQAGENEFAADWNENDRYFFSSSDMSIFAKSNMSAVVETDSSIQGNMNMRVNTYSAKIDFSASGWQFADRNYMVFSADTASQIRDPANGMLNPSAGTVTYCDRTMKGFTALMVAFPAATFDIYGKKYPYLGANSFSCSVIGRWKK